MIRAFRSTRRQASLRFDADRKEDRGDSVGRVSAASIRSNAASHRATSRAVATPSANMASRRSSTLSTPASFTGRCAAANLASSASTAITRPEGSTNLAMRTDTPPARTRCRPWWRRGRYQLAPTAQLVGLGVFGHHRVPTYLWLEIAERVFAHTRTRPSCGRFIYRRTRAKAGRRFLARTGRPIGYGTRLGGREPVAPLPNALWGTRKRRSRR